jgi:hypothetical protein
MLQRQWQNDYVTETMTEWLCYRDDDKMTMVWRGWQNNHVTDSVTEWICYRDDDRIIML